MDFKFIFKHNSSFGKKWQNDAIGNFSARLSDSDFPCIFGLKAFRNGGILFLFVEENDEKFINGLIEYTNFINTIDNNEKIKHPLVVFFNKECNSLLKDHEFAWEQINFLHKNDPKKWRGDTSINPNSSNFSFCFNNMQLFFNISSPNHKMLKNRNLGSFITFIINPRVNFDTVAPQTTKNGLETRKLIRDRVKKYNGGYMPKELGFFGDKENFRVEAIRATRALYAKFGILSV